MSEFDYYEGFFSFRNETLEVLMDVDTFDKYLAAALARQGIDTRSECELLEYVSQVQEQRREVEKVLQNPDYWIAIADPNVRVIQRNTTSSHKLAEEENEDQATSTS